jgi:hypothetical protein
VKTLDDFDFSFARSVKRAQIAHLAQLDFLQEATNVVFLGPPGTGKTLLSIPARARQPALRAGTRGEGGAGWCGGHPGYTRR